MKLVDQAKELIAQDAKGAAWFCQSDQIIKFCWGLVDLATENSLYRKQAKECAEALTEFQSGGKYAEYGVWGEGIWNAVPKAVNDLETKLLTADHKINMLAELVKDAYRAGCSDAANYEQGYGQGNQGKDILEELARILEMK